ncbi:MFS transporter [Virgisporangium ochraceum]
MLSPERGTALVFAVSGAVQASWVSRLPAVQERLRLGVDELGLALGALGMGTIAGMFVTGRLSTRLGSRRVILASALGTAATLVVAALAPTALTLVGASFTFGMTIGAWDAAMNIQGVAVAQELGGHLMARFHGFWSIGTVVGAGTGAIAARGGVPVGVQCVVVAGAATYLVWLGSRVPVGDPPADDRKPVRVTGRLALLGSLILAGGFIEGAANDWLAVMLADERGFSHARAAVAYAVFVAAMTAGRFAAARLYRRVTPDRLVRAGALLAGAGVIATVLAPLDAIVYAGAAVWGLGICVVFPVVVTAGGTEPGADQVVGALTTIGYGAGFVGPLALGPLAERTGLGVALLAVPVLALGVAGCASAVRPMRNNPP